MTPIRKSSAPARAQGYTIIEVMISITIGLIILAGLVTLFAGNSRERGELERANEQTENGRYAMQVISDDLRSAGYLATLNPGGTTGALPPGMSTPAAPPNICATDRATLLSALSMPVQGFHTPLTAPACLLDWAAGTDILVVRRASTCAVGAAGCDALVNGDLYLQVSGCSAELNAGVYFTFDYGNSGNFNFTQKDCATPALRYQFRTHIYYIANDDKGGDLIPTLMRAELGAGTFTIVPIAEGVQNLQLQYGLDTSVPTTGTPAVYTADPGSYLGCIPANCVNNWRNTVSVKIFVLGRNLTPTQGYQDTKTYTLGVTAVAAFGDGFKRHVFSTVAVLYNTVGRNSP